MKSSDYWSNDFREYVYRLHDFVHVSSSEARADPPVDKILIVNEKFYCFNHTL